MIAIYRTASAHQNPVRQGNNSDQQYFEDLVPEDWQSFLRHPTTACEILLRAPSARHDPAAREFILQNGSRTAVFEILGRDPVPPGEGRAAALAILRVCPWDFDGAFERWPELKAGLELADIARLLESDNGMVRQKAILILGGLQAPPSAAVSRESERRT